MHPIFKISATLFILNLASFLSFKSYFDYRQAYIVSATCKSTVEVAAIGPIISRIPCKRTNKQGTNTFCYEKRGMGTLSLGTGVIVSNDGLVLTCAHVVGDVKQVYVSLNGFNSDRLSKPRIKHISAYVVGVDEEHDLALVRIAQPPRRLKVVHLATQIYLGSPVFTIGFPVKFEKYVTSGVISNFDDGWTYSDTVIEHGSSGGGLFDMNGNLVGLADAIFYTNPVFSYQGFSVFTNLEAMHKLIEKYGGF